MYDRFVAFYGPINKPVNAKLLEGSVEGPFLKALEQYDRISATAKKAGLFSGPLVRSARKTDAPSVTDALLICLDRLGRVDIETIAEASGVSQAEALRQLGDLVYQEPGSGKWLATDEYLSGNVMRNFRLHRRLLTARLEVRVLFEEPNENALHFWRAFFIKL